MSVKITYFVHGTTTDNEQDLATGWQPGELSNIGISQAKALGEQTANITFDVVYCSDLKRSIDSAMLAFDSKYPVVIDKRIRECDYGDLTGHSASEFKDKMVDYIDTRFPNGESYKDVEVRMRSLVDELRETNYGQHIAIVAHQGPQLALDVILGGKSWQQAIAEDWRKTGKWQPGWEYIID